MNKNKNARLLKLETKFCSEESIADKPFYEMHYHNYFELEIVTKGQGKQIFDGKEFNLKKGSIFLCTPLDSHQIFGRPIVFRHIQIANEVLPKWLLKEMFSIKNPIVFQLTDNDFETINQLMILAKNEYSNSGKTITEQIVAYCVLIFSYFLKYARNTNQHEKESFLKNIYYYINSNDRYKDKITLDDVANYVGYSKYYTSSMFHKLSGQTIQDYIISLRVECAKKMLTDSNISITRIIYECGFNSLTNFYSQFKKIVGLTPKEYKRNTGNKYGNN